MKKMINNKSKGFVIRNHILGSDIRNLRKDLFMTQMEFAAFLNVSKRTIETWESKEEPITGPIVTMFEILSRNPELISYFKVPKTDHNLRLYYMHDEMVCSIIDVCESRRRVFVRNYTDNIYYRAFGINTDPDYYEYEDFLESRCRPDYKGDPSDTPINIIEKTEGRIDGDDFHIRVERA